jgi:hypothetical protein
VSVYKLKQSPVAKNADKKAKPHPWLKRWGLKLMVQKMWPIDDATALGTINSRTLRVSRKQNIWTISVVDAALLGGTGLDVMSVGRGGAADGNVDGRSVFALEVGGTRMHGVKFGAGFQEADATVPAEDAVVVAGWADFLGFSEMVEGFFDERKKDVGGATGVELGFGAAFLEKTGIIVALVGIAEGLEDGVDLAVTIGGGAGELVGDGEAEHAASELMIRVDNQNIAADGFGFLGLVEVAIEFGFGDGFRNACFGDGFELVRHGTSCFGKAWPVIRGPCSAIRSLGFNHYPPR